MRAILVSASTDGVISNGSGYSKLRGFALCAGSAAATAEIFDGTQAAGKSIGKLATAASTSANAVIFDEDAVTCVNGQISVTLSGTGAQAYLYFD